MTSTNMVHPVWSAQLLGHPLVWLVVTLLMLLIGYGWLDQLSTDSPSAPVKKVKPTDFPTNAEQADELIKKEESMAITQKGDTSRAQQYLEQEEIESSIQPILETALGHIESGQLVQPPGDNAWDDYHAILVIDSNHNAAKSGLNKIRNILIDNAETAIELGEFADAENWLVQLDLIQPDDEIQSDLRNDISIQIELEAKIRLRQQKEEERLQNIQNSLAQASEAESDKPINYNKIQDLYNHVLEIDPDNQVAKQGLIRLADSHLDRVEIFLRSQELEQAQSAMRTAVKIDPKNVRISALEIALDSSFDKREQMKIAETEKAKAEKAKAEKIRAEALAAAEISRQTLNSDPPGSGSIESTKGPQASTGFSSRSPSVVESPKKPKIDALELEVQKIQRLEEGVRAYYEGEYNKSFELLHLLAEEGVARAQFRIGIMYRFGRSVATNKDLGEKWFTKAIPSVLRSAQQGVAWAQTDLGTAYEMGITMQKDFERAAFWYQKAAEQGYPGAQTNLGVLYATGDGVNYDRSKAIFWLKKAASKGDVVALENLQIMGVSN